MNRAIAILRSARGDGNTARVLESLVGGLPCDTVDLSARQIAPFTYAQQYGQGDEFLDIIRQIVEAPLTILATPVYWYSYSAQMKIFVDRFTDLLMSEKPLGRRLRGRSFALVASGNSPEPEEILNRAFDSFCGYLGIHNAGMAYACEDGAFFDERAVEHIRAHLRATGGQA
jgi:multimeric flavodoxin WrbA